MATVLPSQWKQVAEEMKRHLEGELVPFWASRCRDKTYGGYLTNFDAEGRPLGTPEKYLNTQARFVWGFSRFHRLFPDQPDLLDLARQGVDFLVHHFWDREFGGWVWKTHADGSWKDDAKIVYGQSFAIYALSEYYRSTQEERVLEYASRTFDLLQIFCADTLRGGYFENLTRDWCIASGPTAGGDRKTLDTHMHLMESFANLYRASGREIHRRKLSEVLHLIRQRMIDPSYGCGGNHFDLEFQPIPAIAIDRTWNAEREGTRPAGPLDTTSFGHNVELAWLMNDALDTLQAEKKGWQETLRRLLDHAVQFGVDREYGGIYRDGTRGGNVTNPEKEFWQHAEVLVGFLDGYLLFQDPRYWDAFQTVWNFVDRFMIRHDVGEWHTLLDRQGNPIDPNIGNPWKVCYHTGRSMVECLLRLQKIGSECLGDR